MHRKCSGPSTVEGEGLANGHETMVKVTCLQRARWARWTSSGWTAARARPAPAAQQSERQFITGSKEKRRGVKGRHRSNFVAWLAKQAESSLYAQTGSNEKASRWAVIMGRPEVMKEWRCGRNTRRLAGHKKNAREPESCVAGSIL